MNVKRIIGLVVASFVAIGILWFVFNGENPDSGNQCQVGITQKQTPTPQVDIKQPVNDLDINMPLWSVEVDPLRINADEQYYYLLIEDKALVDPRSSLPMHSDPNHPTNSAVMRNVKQVSIFQYPSPTVSLNPKINDEGKLTFLYQGELSIPAYLVADCLGGTAYPEMFVPYNEPARDNFKSIRSDQTLGKVKGRVINEQGDPVSGAHVASYVRNIERTTHAKANEIYFPAKTNESGEFIIECLLPDQYSLFAFADGYLNGSTGKLHDVIAGQSIDGIEIVMRTGGVICGTVTNPQNAPVEGAIVRTSTNNTITNANGKYELIGIFPFSYTVIAEAEGFGAAVRNDVQVELGKKAIVDLQLTSGAVLDGVVIREVNGEDRGVAQVIVSLHTERIAPYAKVITDATGAFSFDGLPPDVEFGIIAKYNQLATSKNLKVILRENRRHKPLELRLPAAALISGQVVDEKGQPVSGAIIYQFLWKSDLYRSGGGRINEHTLHKISDMRGRFTLTELYADTEHTLLVRADGYADTITDPINSAMKKEVKIILLPGASIEGRVIDGDTNMPLHGVELTIGSKKNRITAYNPKDNNYFSVSDGDGNFVFRDLPGGDYDLRGFFSIDSERVNWLVEPITNISISEKQNKEFTVKAWAPSEVNGQVVEIVEDLERGVGGAQVHVKFVGDNNVSTRDPDFQQNISGITNRKGNFQFYLLPGEYSIKCSHKEFKNMVQPESIFVVRGKDLSDIKIIRFNSIFWGIA